MDGENTTEQAPTPEELREMERRLATSPDALNEMTLGVVARRDDYTFPDDEYLAIMTDAEKQEEFLKAVAAGWSSAEASGTIWPDGSVVMVERSTISVDALAELTTEVEAWRQLARGEVPERMTSEQFAFSQMAPPAVGTAVDTKEDTPMRVIPDAEPTPSEVLYAFAAWLTTRDETAGPFNRHHDSSQASTIVQRFIKSQEFAPPREDWPSRFKMYPQD